ncbi:peptidase T [[Clostridium] symbiosum]|uniref:peptidase T n=1 Tax=Clostridium symbiosum TaxID=1512 RepID=UPI00210B2C29|nr:peptidase T [[Clostridium] symbiosum]MCQ4988125.1 peptidase T [[Clostridium] symbiosum]
MSKVAERFLKYVSFDTQSKDEEEQVPSTEKQIVLAKELVKELEEMGASDVRLSEHGYVYATIEANTEKNVPSLGFVAHMDTAPAMSGRDVKARIVEKYAGGDIVLNEEKNIVMTVKDFPFMADCEGRDLIVTDGTTLLGGDDKAGVAEIMTMAAWLLAHPEIPHGTIRIGFTPDEEVGRGADFFDVEGFGADVAYTVDGGPLGELEYENFNAASGKVYIHGVGIHPGGAKNKMKSALLIGMEFQSLLPAFENPMYTDGYEGFFHLDQFAGDVEYAKMDYLIRDHDMDKFTQKKELFASAAEFLNKKYGEGTVELKIKDSYYNMKEKIEPYKYLIDIAKEAMEEVGITPEVSPIRGGTDGARLSYMGLPCPNLCTGGYNFHGKFEFIPVQSMEKVVELLLTIVRKFEKIEK